MKVSPGVLLFFSCLFKRLSAEYEIGVGIADVTGPIAEIGFMGYGKFDQLGSGLHLRQWARSYIISDGVETLVFVSVDVGMMGDGVRLQVLDRLKKKFGSLYNVNNVIISGTHTHSAPGGFLMHFLFDLPIWGFSSETFWGLVDGIFKSIERAHFNRRMGKLYLAKGEVLNANINRSPTAYNQNPAAERARYENNTDVELVQIKFVSTEGEPLGVINWFPVHPTSMNNTNTYVSSDNVGYASIKFEEKMNPNRILGRGPFVASFASSNLGDVSPNIKGPRCTKSGKPCDINTSSCPDRHDLCIASGPGRDMFESTAIIADRMFQKAWELWNDADTEIRGPVKVIHQYVDMPTAQAEIVLGDGTRVTVGGCVPAMGYSFAAGTTDGPGAFSFRQGILSSNPMWNLVRNILARPTEEDIRCHAPKPILLATGRMSFPFDWQPRIVSTQLGLVGNVALVAVPGEFTTMSGRRMKNEIASIMSQAGYENPTAIIAGLCNTYSDYITTYEEYQVQRYEGASTIFGPHTLSLYLAQYRKLLDALLEDTPLNGGPKPQGLGTNRLSFIPGVFFDTAKLGSEFGNVVQEPQETARPGDVVKARFVSGHPRKDLKHGETFCTVERSEGPDVWTVVATDANWETKVRWIRTRELLGQSEMEIEWTVPEFVIPGTYRIKHFGSFKQIFGRVFPYEGSSKPFEIEDLKAEVPKMRNLPTDGRWYWSRFEHLRLNNLPLSSLIRFSKRQENHEENPRCSCKNPYYRLSIPRAFIINFLY